MILKRKWAAVDGTTASETFIPAGTHEIERIPNPLGYKGYWLVLKGTKIGGSEGSWRQWENGQLVDNPGHPNHGKPIDWGDFEVQITD